MVDSGLNGRGSSSGSELLLSLRGGLDLKTLLVLTQDLTVVSLEPLLEWSGVNLNNSRLGQSVSSDQLVVRRVVDDRSNSGLSSDTFTTPREVTGLNSQGSELLVTTSGSDSVDSLGTNLGVGWLSAQLKLSLLSELGSFGTGCRTLVTRVSGDTHAEDVSTMLLSMDRMFSRLFDRVRDAEEFLGDAENFQDSAR